MKNPIKHSFYLLFQAEDLIPLAVGTIVLTIITDNISGLLSQILENRLGSPILANLILIPIPILLAILFLSLYTTWRDRRLTQSTSPTQATPPPHKGLILLVSRLEPCQKAIEHHKPTLQHCWLICSERTWAITQKLRETYPDICTTAPIVIDPTQINDPLEFEKIIDQIYTQQRPLGWQETDIIADYTGMTAHASVGVALACLSTGRPLQYTPAIPSDEKGDRIAGSGTPIAISLNPLLELPPALARRDRRPA